VREGREGEGERKDAIRCWQAGTHREGEGGRKEAGNAHTKGQAMQPLPRRMQCSLF